MVQMALVFEGANTTWVRALDIMNYFFTSVFILEAILKLIAYGSTYFRTTWNKFDFIIVVSSICDIVVGIIVK